VPCKEVVEDRAIVAIGAHRTHVRI
jgi:hypothetical protein